MRTPMLTGLYNNAASARAGCRALLRVCCVLLTTLLLPTVATAHEPGDESKPAPDVRMRVIAPSAHGPWLLRVDNEGDEPVRLAADVRLLRFEINTPSSKPGPPYGRHSKTLVCDARTAFGVKNFPYDRELILEPGHSYVEQFDPRLVCFGKAAKALAPGATVKAYLGWPPKKRWRKGAQSAPFVLDAAVRPRRFKPMRRLAAPTMLLSHAPPASFAPKAEATDKPGSKSADGPAGDKPAGDKPAADEPAGDKSAGDKPAGDKPTADEPAAGKAAADPAAAAKGGAAGPVAPARSAEEASRYRLMSRKPPRRRPKKDELAARLTLTSDHYDDARRASDVVISVQAHNTGERPIFVALRSRQLGFKVLGPNGPVRCGRQSQGHHIPRDLFRTLHHGKHIHMNVRLAEVCPPGTFKRPGLYRIIPRLHADATGEEYGLHAATGVVTVRDPGTPGGTHRPDDDVTLVRIRRGPRPFYRGRPTAIPTTILPRP